MKVCVLDTAHPHEGRGLQTIVEMPQCPAVDEMVFVTDDRGITVKSVLWTPYSKDYDVQIRCW